MNNHTWWYIARSGGIIAWVLLAISMFWGLALSSRFLGKRPKPNWMLDLHRFVGGLATVFTLVHVVALMLDTYVGFSLANVLVPFTGSYHPLAVGWGVIAMYFLIAVEITSLLRKKLSKRAWRHALPQLPAVRPGNVPPAVGGQRPHHAGAACCRAGLGCRGLRGHRDAHPAGRS